MLLTGIRLARTGEVEANLVQLNEEAKLPYLDDLIARKTSGPEKGTLTAADLTFHESEYRRLRSDLESARDASPLPDSPRSKDALNDLLIRLRLHGISHR